jgi:predicted ester cyclase
MTPEANKALALRAHEAFVNGDIASLRDYLTPDCVLHQCGFLEPIRGAQHIGEFAGGGGAVSERKRWVEEAVAEGDTVAVRWTTSGLYTGPMLHGAPGKPVTFGSMTFIRMQDGKIAEIWNIQDTASLRTQLEEPVASR